MHQMVPMSSGARGSVTAAIGAHDVQFYAAPEYLHDRVGAFVADGLARGERVLVIATEANRRGIAARLAARGVDLSSPSLSGRYVAVDAEETLATLVAPGRSLDRARLPQVFDQLLGADAERRPVRAYGEMVNLLWRRGDHERALELEALWDELLEEQPGTSLLCGYSLDDFEGEPRGAGLERVCDRHRHVLAAEDVPQEGDARQREIVRLQLRARALEHEIRRREAVEQALRETLSELRRSEEALRDADRRKDEFLAMLGHELRNPLSAILTGVQLMRRGSSTSHERHQEIVERQARHLARLVDDLLDVSRITQGKVRLDRAPVPVGEVISRALEIVRSVAHQRGQTIHVDAPAEGLVVSADAVRLAQVFGNLLANASKYSAAGGDIAVRAWREGADVVVSVRDRGIGIAPELLPRIFDLFVQAEPGRDRAQGGLGVGLTLARRLVDMHGGTIEARSDGPGAGSELVVRLPAVDAALDPAPGPAEAREPRRAAERILVVDDNVDAGEVLAEALRAHGHEVELAQDGVRALALARAFRPRTALLDIGLPGMDGYELARRLRELGDEGPVRLVAMTGYGQQSDRAESHAAGFDLHLVKPLDLERVVALFDDGGTVPTAA
jgi:signal transduction histidine kinase/ActR/RegA family two-component response regulator